MPPLFLSQKLESEWKDLIQSTNLKDERDRRGEDLEWETYFCLLVREGALQGEAWAYWDTDLESTDGPRHLVSSRGR